MEYTYTALLLEETGQEVNETNVTAVLDAAGVAVDESRAKALVAALEGVDLADMRVDSIRSQAEPAEGDLAAGEPVIKNGDTPADSTITESADPSNGDADPPADGAR